MAHGTRVPAHVLAVLCVCAVVMCVPSAAHAAAAGSVTVHAGWPACEPRALQASGYIDIPGVPGSTKHFFYWLFGPRKVPADGQPAPVILWLSGGPGCSSVIALALENGPCLLNEAKRELEHNPYGWNEEAYLLYIDQPVGTGYSYSENEADYVSNEAEVAEDMFHVLQRFAATFSEPSISLRNPFYIIGESYAGHYVPAIAQRILVANQRGEGFPLLLKAVGIGNGLTNPRLQKNSYAYFSYFYCKMVLGHPCVTQENYESMVEIEPKCERAMKLCEAASENKLKMCEEADEACSGLMSYYSSTGLNVYDIRKPCVGDLCYPMNYTTEFSNNLTVKAALGVNMAREWETCNMAIHARFTIDSLQNYDGLVKQLLEGGIRVLIYAGDMDFICNFVGNQMWVRALEWSGREAFRAAPENGFRVGDRWAGSEQRAGLLSFVRIFGAGHMVPMDQPEVSAYMVHQFLLDEPLAGGPKQ